MVAENRISVLCIQETHFQGMPVGFINSLWRGSCFDSAWVDATGRSGGILTVWDQACF